MDKPWRNVQEKRKRVRGAFPWSYFTIGEDILPQF
jgi:hypothetical protein